MTTTLVLGGTRSGKSRHAEDLLRRHERVTYVATRPDPGEDVDPELSSRIRMHQERRPVGWRTEETRDLTRALLGSRNPVLIDCVGAWLRGQLDDHDLWEDPAGAKALIDGLADELAVAAQALPFEVVLVSEDASGLTWSDEARARLFAHLLADVNCRLSAAATGVHVVLAGRVLDLSSAPVIGR